MLTHHSLDIIKATSNGFAGYKFGDCFEARMDSGELLKLVKCDYCGSDVFFLFAL